MPIEKTMPRHVSLLRCLIVATLALAVVGMAEACPSCKAALAADSGRGDLVSGFFWSILFMLSMPFMVLGGMSGYFYYLVRRARPANEPADAPREG
jgi:hypothetical protein